MATKQRPRSMRPALLLDTAARSPAKYIAILSIMATSGNHIDVDRIRREIRRYTIADCEDAIVRLLEASPTGSGLESYTNNGADFIRQEIFTWQNMPSISPCNAL